MEGAAPIWFCKREGCPLLLVAEEKKKIKGSGARRRAVRVCMGLWEELDYGGEKKKRKGRLFAGKTGQKSLFCANFELPFFQPLEHEN
jgi:hypothetical protein